MGSFIHDVKRIYRVRYLNRRPTREEMGCIDSVCADAGFPGCIRTVDGTKLLWNNCPDGYKRQYHNSKERNMVTVAV